MNYIQKILIIPLLSPLIILLLISSLNYNKPIKVKLLTWESPEIPLGGLMAIGALSGGCIAFLIGALPSSNSKPLRRKVKYNGTNTNEVINDKNNENFNYFQNDIHTELIPDIDPSDYPQRDLRDPQPTIATPFRIIKKGRMNNKSKVKSEEYKNNINDLSDLEEDYNPNNYIDFQDRDDFNYPTEDWGQSLDDTW